MFIDYLILQILHNKESNNIEKRLFTSGSFVSKVNALYTPQGVSFQKSLHYIHHKEYCFKSHCVKYTARSIIKLA